MHNNDGFESASRPEHHSSQLEMLDVLPAGRTDWNTHPKVEEDTKEGERPKEAAGQCSQQLWLSLGCGWHHLPVPFSAGRKELHCKTVKMQWRRQNGRNTQPDKYQKGLALALLSVCYYSGCEPVFPGLMVCSTTLLVINSQNKNLLPFIYEYNFCEWILYLLDVGDLSLVF